jgi:hypothetical protein
MTNIPLSEEADQNRFALYAFRVLGAFLLLLLIVPLYRMVASADTDRIASDVVDAADTSRTLMLLGTFITVTIGVLASRLVDSRRVEQTFARVGRRLISIPPLWFAGSLAIVSAIITAVFSIAVLDAKPNLIDAMVQLAQARYVAAGHLSGPVGSLTEFWYLPNSIVTPNGWVSQYPPGYLILLGVGLRFGVSQFVGPLLVSITVFFAALAGERLYAQDRVVPRLGAILLAFSPFLIGLAGAYMNHVGAAAFISVALYCALRSRDAQSFFWAVLCGAAVGVVFSVRPLTAVVAAFIVATVWLMGRSSTRGVVAKSVVRQVFGAMVGIAPFFLALAAYNRHFFGSPLRFGYSALVGPLVGPGFHRDPSGHIYGPLQALGYTSSDLVTLSMYLLETPISAILVIGLFLLFSRRLERGTQIVVLWAFLPVLANAFYWHHGIFMGPRMLNEWTPAWALLTAAAAVGLVRRIPPEKTFGSYSPRTGLALAIIFAWVAAIFYLGPQRLVRYGGSWMASTRMRLPVTSTQALVFVHGGWPTRIAVRLSSHGFRGDSLEAAMALNATCDVQKFANWYAAQPGTRPASRPALNFDFSAPNHLQKMDIAQGDQIRYHSGSRLPADCLRQVASDTLGVIDISPLVWQNDLPGLDRTGAMVVRDMGPEENAAAITRYPGRAPMILFRATKEGPPTLVPYDVGIKALWPNG